MFGDRGENNCNLWGGVLTKRVEKDSCGNDNFFF